MPNSRLTAKQSSVSRKVTSKTRTGIKCQRGLAASSLLTTMTIHCNAAVLGDVWRLLCPLPEFGEPYSGSALEYCYVASCTRNHAISGRGGSPKSCLASAQWYLLCHRRRGHCGNR